MKYFFHLLLLLILAGCCRIADIPERPAPIPIELENTLYEFRLERSGATRLSGLLALKQQSDGIWAGLLDATGVPLVKLLVHPDGVHDVEYCAAAVCDTRLPEVLGKLVYYIYFTPANASCPWYTVSCICEESENAQHTVKWKKFGPLHSWEVQHKKAQETIESIDIQMYFSSVRIHLQPIDTQAGT